MSKDTEHAHNYAAGLRQLADCVDAHPELFCCTSGLMVNLFAQSRDEFAERARQLGSAEKVEVGDWYVLRKTFGPHCVDLNIARSKVCSQVQVGICTVSVPDPEAVSALPLVEIEQPVYEWQCPDSILQPTAEAKR